MSRNIILLSFIAFQIMQTSALGRSQPRSPRRRETLIHFSEEMRADIQLFMPLLSVGLPFTVGYLLLGKDLEIGRKDLEAVRKDSAAALQTVSKDFAAALASSIASSNRRADSLDEEFLLIRSDLAKMSKDIEKASFNTTKKTCFIFSHCAILVSNR